MDFTPPFGSWLKRQRARLDLTQADLARRLGYSPVTIRKIEAGDLRPSKQFIDLVAEILSVPDGQRGDFRAFARATRVAATMAPPAAEPGEPRHANLPVAATHLIGRERDVAALRHLLNNDQTAPRLVTLVGPPGVGKTRLALATAHEIQELFRDGAWWVELAPITDPQTVLAAIVQALEIRDQPGRPLLQVLQDHLRDRCLLLVLDNLEQVLDAAPLLGQVLSAAPEVKILATSRETLRIQGEQVYEVDPLEGEAVDLFVVRARAIKADFALTDVTTAVVAEICRKLDGLPLAIELAAARIAVFSPTELLARLDHRVAVLTEGARDLPPRQRTLRATLDWSYDLLTPDEQVLLRRLGVFATPPSLSAVEAVCADGVEPPTLITSLSGLVAKSMVKHSSDASGASRYRLLETIREYALNRLVESGEADSLHRRLGEYLLTLTTNLRISHPDDADNWRAALKWALTADESGRLAMRLADVWGPFAISPREAKGWLEKMDARAVALNDPALRVEVMLNLGTILHSLGDRKRAQPLFEATASSPHARGLHLAVTGSYFMLGHIAREAGDVEASRSHFAYCRRHCPEEAPYYVFWLLTSMSETEVVAEDSAAARRLLDECQNHDPQHAHGPEFVRAWWFNHMAHVLMLEGDLTQAQQCLQHSLSLYPEQSVDGDFVTASNHESLGEIALSAGRPEEAYDHLQTGLRPYAWRGDSMGVSWCLAGLAGAAALDEDPERGAILWGAGEALRERLGCRIAPASRKNRERTVALLQAQLGESEFAHLAAEGAKMSIDDAVAFALAAPRP